MSYHRPADLPLPDFDESALFLDFDGTLVEIADRPDAVQLPPRLPLLLAALGRRFAGGVALISGRPIADIDHYLPRFGGPVAGGHGAEWRDGAETWRHPFSDDPVLPELRERMRRWVKGRRGVLLEDKPTGIVLHYRQAPEAEAEIRQEMMAALAPLDHAELHESKMALEIRPRGIGKDRAMARLLARSGRPRAVMIGDDATDEPALAAAERSGGLAIKVGPGTSAAPWRLEHPAAVLELLETWCVDEDA